ncbi:ATP-binding protein [Kitasatospora sp. NBC_01266]|uniref:ATP-binding protein n=1 Tax=Kitasatospora sp. NBC_01266 TaxID=2903572 RepID=UPI002E34C895|nr:ATP-binding protein [Kitasatospora sp. NBC_01266]
MLRHGTISGSGTVPALSQLADHQAGIPRLARDIEAGPAAARTARWAVRDEYAGRLTPDTAGDLELIVTELVENASAVTVEGATVHVDVRPYSTRLLIEVTDSCDRAPEPRRAADLDEDGRGLLLVGELSESWGWYPSGEGKVVWALCALPDRTAPALGSGPTPTQAPDIAANGASPIGERRRRR